MTHLVRLTEAAEADLQGIFDFLSSQASPYRARAYVTRITDFLARLQDFPERGTIRSDIRPGMRLIGFERRVSIAFVVEGNDVVILRILYAGRQSDLFESDSR